ncbi:MAG: OsmC family protein [Bacteroidota bacterium]
MTTIELRRVDSDYQMEARNATGNTILMDGSQKIGGHEAAMRPMEVLLASMGGCSAIDVISILRKKRQPVDDIRIRLEGEREHGVEPSLFRKIHAHFILYGKIDEAAARQAVELSMDKYCSVAKTLEATATITHSFEIIG